MKSENKKGDWYQAKAENLVINVYLLTISSYSEIWKWEIDFINSAKDPGDNTGWAPSLEEAQKAALEQAELFAGKGGVGEYVFRTEVHPDIET